MKKEDKTNNLPLNSLIPSLSPPTMAKHHEEGRQAEQSFTVSVSSHNEEDKPNNDQELSRKRKNSSQDLQTTHPFQELEEEEEGPDLQLTLSLSFRHAKARRPLSVDQQPESPSPPMDHRSLSVQALFSETPQRPETLQLTPLHTLCLLPLVPESSTPTPPPPPESYTPTPPPPESSTPAPPPPPVYRHEAGTRRVRRSPALRDGKSDTMPAPFPWATTRRAHVHSLDYLRSKQIVTVTGEVQCKKCQRQYEMAYPLEDKFKEVGYFIAINRDSMRDRAPAVWSNPHFPTCNFCGEENSAKPIISEKKKTINWLFLLLGQFLGCLTLEQLKYFCKHTQNHRTGAKDRVLYLTYLALCKQLDPNGPFDC
ncbi:hypothetical protein FH972_005023 [Carpinus fangiana]|uniref:DUF7086 domain-containing protein n=1 Tax=Carpinus fangiana TaxID=176857 RepID=A0A5N6QQE3_9ROSI|nr:hypothetical protein FH972_005023 [Carpinus fangiana]